MPRDRGGQKRPADAIGSAIPVAMWIFFLSVIILASKVLG